MFAAARLTATVRSRPRRATRGIARAPLSSTQRVRSPIAPVRSASGTKSPGGSRPSVGWFQRTSASTPVTRVRADARPSADSAAPAGRRWMAARSSASSWSRSAEYGSRSSEYVSIRVRPRLASYMATSARWTSRLTSRPWSGQSAMPMLASSTATTPLSVNGRSSASCRRPAISTTAARSGTPRRSTANSSPPRRASVSPRRMAARRRSRDLLEQAVAMVVAERVVDLLEAVEVDQQQGRHPAGAPEAGDRLLHALVEQRAVRQVGEVVVQREVAQAPRGDGDDAEQRGEEQDQPAGQQQVRAAASPRRSQRPPARRAGRPRARRRAHGRADPDGHVDLEAVDAAAVVAASRA